MYCTLNYQNLLKGGGFHDLVYQRARPGNDRIRLIDYLDCHYVDPSPGAVRQSNIEFLQLYRFKLASLTLFETILSRCFHVILTKTLHISGRFGFLRYGVYFISIRVIIGQAQISGRLKSGVFSGERDDLGGDPQFIGCNPLLAFYLPDDKPAHINIASSALVDRLCHPGCFGGFYLAFPVGGLDTDFTLRISRRVICLAAFGVSHCLSRMYAGFHGCTAIVLGLGQRWNNLVHNNAAISLAAVVDKTAARIPS